MQDSVGERYTNQKDITTLLHDLIFCWIRHDTDFGYSNVDLHLFKPPRHGIFLSRWTEKCCGPALVLLLEGSPNACFTISTPTGLKSVPILGQFAMVNLSFRHFLENVSGTHLLMRVYTRKDAFSLQYWDATGNLLNRPGEPQRFSARAVCQKSHPCTGVRSRQITVELMIDSPVLRA